MALTRVDNGWVVRTERQIRYCVRVVDDLFNTTFELPTRPHQAPDVLGRVDGTTPDRIVIVDALVMALYGPQIRRWMARHGVNPMFLTIPGGESSKGLRTVIRIWRAFHQVGVARHPSPIKVICIGGGVISDVVGFAASLYRRGVHRIVIPTTLVGMVDAGIAAKTAINLFGWKNRIGTYFPPDLVLIDPHFLRSLQPRRLSDGLAEVVKLAMATDFDLFTTLERHGSLVLQQSFQGTTAQGGRAAWRILERSVSGMLAHLAPNLFEENSARAVYAGHTWSPGIEMAALRASRSTRFWRRRPWLYHGEAVGLDLLLSAGLAVDRGLLPEDDYHRLAGVLDSLNLPTWDPLLRDEDLLARTLADTTAHRGGQPLVPLFTGIGAVHFENKFTPNDIRRAVDRQYALGGMSLA